MLLTIVGVETVVVVVDVVPLTVVDVGTGAVIVDVVVVVVDDVNVVVVAVVVAGDVAVVVSMVADDLTQSVETVSVMYNKNASVGLRSEHAGFVGQLRRASARRAP